MKGGRTAIASGPEESLKKKNLQSDIRGNLSLGGKRLLRKVKGEGKWEILDLPVFRLQSALLCVNGRQ